MASASVTSMHAVPVPSSSPSSACSPSAGPTPSKRPEPSSSSSTPVTSASSSSSGAPSKSSGGINFAALGLLPPNLKLQIFNIMTKADPQLAASEEKEKIVAEGLAPSIFRINDTTPSLLNRFNIDELKQLETRGWLVKDNFMGGEAAAAARAGAQEMVAAGHLKSAGMKSEHGGTWKAEKARGDKICWLHVTDAAIPASLATLLSRLDSLRTELNQAAGFDSPDKVHIQLALYEGNGSRYVRHRDTFEGGPRRRLTVLYYLNLGWKPSDGGVLRLYDPSGPQDVQPIGDRLLVFLSQWIEHEVLPAHADRFALTTWFA